MMQPAEISPAQLPTAIQQALANAQVAVRIERPGANLPDAQRIQSSLLEDSVGTLQVLFPYDALLDLKRLTELTGRDLTVASPKALRATLERQHLQSLPGLPLPSGSPCLYEAAIAGQTRLWADAGEPDLLVSLSGSEFARLTDKATTGHFAVPVGQIHPNLDHPEDDRAQISKAVESFTARRIRQRLEETLEIPPLPQTANKIIRLRVDPNATVDDITDVVETDPALAAQVVAWAASPYYRAPGKIRSVEDAIVRVLGFDLVINLALGLALGKTLALPKDEPQRPTSYWQQAIYTAAVVDGLLRLMPRAQQPEAGLAYLGGLLHNFGYLVLAHVFPPHFALFCRHREVNPHLHHSLIEQHLLGITREQIGAWLMRHWQMPEEIVTAQRFGHDPQYTGQHAAYANLVCLAMRLLARRGIGNDPALPVPEALYQRLAIEPEKAEQALDRIFEAEVALRGLVNQMQPSAARG